MYQPVNNIDMEQLEKWKNETNNLVSKIFKKVKI